MDHDMTDEEAIRRLMPGLSANGRALANDLLLNDRHNLRVRVAKLERTVVALLFMFEALDLGVADLQAVAEGKQPACDKLLDESDPRYRCMLLAGHTGPCGVVGFAPSRG